MERGTRDCDAGLVQARCRGGQPRIQSPRAALVQHTLTQRPRIARAQRHFQLGAGVDPRDDHEAYGALRARLAARAELVIRISEHSVGPSHPTQRVVDQAPGRGHVSRTGLVWRGWLRSLRWRGPCTAIRPTAPRERQLDRELEHGMRTRRMHRLHIAQQLAPACNLGQHTLAKPVGSGCLRGGEAHA